MSLTITNNVGALNARNNLQKSSNMLNKSIERLSTGFKVNRGADGPAALVISEKTTCANRWSADSDREHRKGSRCRSDC